MKKLSTLVLSVIMLGNISVTVLANEGEPIENQSIILEENAVVTEKEEITEEESIETEEAEITAEESSEDVSEEAENIGLAVEDATNNIENATVEYNEIIVEDAQGWIKEGNYWYYYENGAMKTGWLYKNNTWYYLNPETGEMATGTMFIGEDIYCFNNNGEMQSNVWFREVYEESFGDYEDNWYYLTSDGRAYKGWLVVENDWYYLDAEFAHMARGCVSVGDTVYYFDSNGVMRSESGWHKSNWGAWYYLTSNGTAYKGWLEQGGIWYYLDHDYGYMIKGGYNINGTIYFFNANGEMQTKQGWHVDEYGNWYYLNSNGTGKTGWIKEGNNWYYLNEYYGFMLTGGYQIGDIIYYFDDSGVMQNKQGWYQSMFGDWYYLNSQGVCQTGWLQLNNNWYYLNKYTGCMVVGTNYIDGIYYCFNENGVLIE